jgi:hypothetical protein
MTCCTIVEILTLTRPDHPSRGTPYACRTVAYVSTYRAVVETQRSIARASDRGNVPMTWIRSIVDIFYH